MGCSLSSPSNGDDGANDINVLDGNLGTSGGSSKEQLWFKVALIGDKAVGKSCMIYRLMKNHFPERSQSTIGAAFNAKDTVVRDQQGNRRSVKLHLWDTAGEELYRSMTKSFIRNSGAAVLVFDVSRKDSFESADYWLKTFREDNPRSYVLLVGNKTDCHRKVSAEEARHFVDSHKKELKEDGADIAYMECSAKTGFNISEVFEFLAEQLYHHNTLS
eukprot:gb/GECG01016717.1/.p1 GENE.gb/GECG01016717.1/~~gb/GECG01016717.1/.p1  ORF type:complete len:217 (+),score=26.15 gb/GECG01016717.1/:1-651(+)